MIDPTTSPRVILRRRAGGMEERVEHGRPAGDKAPQQLTRRVVLGSDAQSATPRGHLLAAAENINETLQTGVDMVLSTKRLYPEQATVFEDTVTFFGECADHVVHEGNVLTTPLPRGRIELPPGVGKTVVIGKIIAGSGATALVVTPRATLVEQMERDLRAQIPGVPVGVYSGDRKELVQGGVIITTNAMMYQWLREGNAPKAIREATLTFFDEGHMMLTAKAVDVINGVVGRYSVVIGLSGSPHYSDKKTMAHVFPRLIHRIDFMEALALGLIAKPRCGVYEVDVDGSDVRVVKGNYDPKTLERIERQAPFFQAALDLRYEPGNIGTKAVVVCRTQQQAYDCQKFFAAHRPAGTPLPVVIVSDMKQRDRRRALAEFESGKTDTIINVKVLTLGWNHPECKVMVDMSFTLSLVEAIQKWLRITRLYAVDGVQVLPRLYLLIPYGLPSLPVLPTDLFGMDVETDEDAFLALRQQKVIRPVRAKKAAIERRRSTPIAEVSARIRKIMDVELKVPQLDRRNDEQIRDVLQSNEAFQGDNVPARTIFRELLFEHSLFTGSGTQLMRYLRITDPVRYAQLMVRLFPWGRSRYLLHIATSSQDPERYAELLMLRLGRNASKEALRRAAQQAADEEWGTAVDLQVLEAETRRQLKQKRAKRVSHDIECAWQMFGEREEAAAPDELLHRARVEHTVSELLGGNAKAERDARKTIVELDSVLKPLDEARERFSAEMAKETPDPEAAKRFAREHQEVVKAHERAYWRRENAQALIADRAPRRRVLLYNCELAETDKTVKQFVEETQFPDGNMPEKFHYHPAYKRRVEWAETWFKDVLREELRPKAYVSLTIDDLFWS